MAELLSSEVMMAFFSVILVTILAKGAYDIYINGVKAHLKSKPIIKIGLPILALFYLVFYLLGS